MAWDAEQEPASLDGHIDPYHTAWLIDYMITDPLLILGPDGQYHPALARTWTASPGADEWTFHLRGDVTFQDGTPFNAQALKYGLCAADAIRAAIRGGSPDDAVEAAACSKGAVTALAQRVRKAQPDHVRFALDTGQNCPVPNAFPVALHAALFGGDFKDTVRNSILAGGDSSGRLFVAAAIRGATDGVPGDWLANLTDRARIEELLAKL